MTEREGRCVPEVVGFAKRVQDLVAKYSKGTFDAEKILTQIDERAALGERILDVESDALRQAISKEIWVASKGTIDEQTIRAVALRLILKGYHR